MAKRATSESKEWERIARKLSKNGNTQLANFASQVAKEERNKEGRQRAKQVVKMYNGVKTPKKKNNRKSNNNKGK